MDDSIIQKNIEVLAQMKNASARRRLITELQQMYPLYTQITAEMDDDKKLTVTVYDIPPDNQLQQYSFVISEHYPFRAPAIFYQNRPYIDFLRVNPSGTSLLRKLFGQNCFCCSSINCGENWGPAMKLSAIINEVRTIKMKKRAIIYKMCADIIKRKYLIADVNLDGWLFST